MAGVHCCFPVRNDMAWLIAAGGVRYRVAVSGSSMGVDVLWLCGLVAEDASSPCMFPCVGGQDVYVIGG